MGRLFDNCVSPLNFDEFSAIAADAANISPNTRKHKMRFMPKPRYRLVPALRERRL